MSSNIFYYLGGVVLIVSGLLEVRRLWNFRQHGIKEIHWGFYFFASMKSALGGKKQARNYLKDVRENWEKYHWQQGIYSILGIPFGLLLLYLLLKP